MGIQIVSERANQKAKGFLTQYFKVSSSSATTESRLRYTAMIKARPTAASAAATAMTKIAQETPTCKSGCK
jgi:hypothetical protein